MESVMDDPPRGPQCDCSRTEVRRRAQSNGVTVYVRQCLHCGSNRGCVRKDSVHALPSSLPAWDEGLRERWQQKRNAFWDQQRQDYEAARDRESQEFWEFYERHLQSPEWADLRRRVLDRCAGVCEGCRRRRAAHVHHLTYKRLGNEMLFDLVGVCKPCHDSIHGKDTAEPGYTVKLTRKG